MERNIPTVSVVIPAYNEEKYLPRTLASLQKQTTLPFEIIVADNNSTDKTAQIAREYGAKVISVQTQGSVYAYAEGMKAAKGDIIACTDADTVVLPNWLAGITRVFKDEKVVGVTGAVKFEKTGFLQGVLEFLYSLFLRVHFLFGIGHTVGFNMAVRKSAFERIGGINIQFTMSSDVDLGVRLTKIGKVVYSPSIKVIPSTRRWEKSVGGTFIDYLKGYFYAVWLRRPPIVHQVAVR